MKLCEAVLVAIAVAIAAAMAWAAAGLAAEPFYQGVAVFSAAFWGALAGCGVWGGICRWNARSGLPEASIIMPAGRRWP